MIQRKIKARLERFLKDDGKYALLIDGARQVGKTYIVRDFARRNYDGFLEINFIENAEAKGIFENSSNVREVLLKLTAFAKTELKKGKTLL